MIDESRIRHMAREYQTNYSTARKLLEQARDVSALWYGRKYRKMTGGEAGEQETLGRNDAEGN